MLGLLVVAFRPSAVPVEVGLVDRGPLQSFVEGEGKTRVRNRYVVSSEVAGRLSRVELVEGEPVKAGQVVARVDPLPLLSAIAQDEARLSEIQAQRAGVGTLRPKTESVAQAHARADSAQADWEAAKAKLEEAKAQLAQAVRDRDRARKLYAQGGIARADLENAELAASTRQSEFNAALLGTESAGARVDEARNGVAEIVAKQSDPDYLLNVYDAQIEATQADLRKLRQDASRTQLRSPVTGRVLRVAQKSEQFVNAGTPVLEIGDPKAIEIVVELLSTDAVAVRPGAAMSIDDGSGAWQFHGRVRYVEPSAFTKVSALGVEEQRVNVIGDFVGASRGIGDAYRVEARIVTWEAGDTLRLPASALFRCQDQWCVYRLHGRKAAKSRVTVDHIGAQYAQLLAGLEAGTRVIVYPSDKIGDGTRISVADQQ